MGINGLLQALKPITKQVHVRQYEGQQAAVDGYSWLHKGAYCCARELCEGVWTDRFVVYFMSRIQLLRTHGLAPIVVFDGGRLPIKGDEEDSRRRARAEARDKAAAYLAAGNAAMAQECYQRCVDVTPAMAKQVIEELKAQGVAFLVAPYEADAQMAFLARSGQVQLVVTEDSDLLAYGCPRVLYKLDKTGTGEEICLADLPNCPGLPLAGWTSDQFLQLCVMAGCDFLTQLPGIGLKKAHGVLRKYRSFTKVVKMLRFNGTKVPSGYEVRFQLALWAFRHARVYCSTQQALVHLAPLPGGGIAAADVDVPAAVLQLEEQQQHLALEFLGPLMQPEVARGIAEGELDPCTHRPYDLATIYAGCRAPPTHIAAQLARLLPSIDPGAAELPCSSSQAAAAFSGGARLRVGLSKRHASYSRGAQSGVFRAVGSAGGSCAGTASAARQQQGGWSGSSKKRNSLGIAKYFNKHAVPAAAGPGKDGANSGDQPAAVGTDTSAAVSPRSGIKHGISKVLGTLGQQLQQRQRQRAAEKELLLQQLQEQQQAGDGAASAACSQGHLNRSQSHLVVDMSECSDTPVLQGRHQPEGSQELGLSVPISVFGGAVPEELVDAVSLGQAHLDDSLSLGVSGGGSLAGSDSRGLAAGFSQPGAAGLLSSDPSILLTSSQGTGSQPVRPKGAAVSALSALLVSTPSTGLGTPSATESGPLHRQRCCSSQVQLLSVAGGEPVETWTRNLDNHAAGGPLSQQPELGGDNTLISSIDVGGSLDGCGSSSEMGFGAAAASQAHAHAAAVDGIVPRHQGDRAGGDMGLEVGHVPGSEEDCMSCQPLQLGSTPQQLLSTLSGNRSSYFCTDEEQVHAHATRRHSRFKEQLLQGSPDSGANPEVSVTRLQGLQGHHHHQQQQQQQDHDPQQAAGWIMPHIGASNPDCNTAGCLPAQQNIQRQSLQVSQTSDDASGSTSNDENAEDAATLEHLGITHVRQFAKLARKVVRTVSKQQQQQQRQQPLAPSNSLLNVQLQQRQCAGSKQPEHPEQRHQAVPEGSKAAASSDKVWLQTALRSKGSALTSRKSNNGKAAANRRTSSFAAKLASMRYDTSMFVQVDMQDEQQPQGAQHNAVAMAEPVQGAPVAASAACKPFKSPWLTGISAADGVGSSDLLSTKQILKHGADGGAEAEMISPPAFGAFGAFACSVFDNPEAKGRASAHQRPGKRLCR